MQSLIWHVRILLAVLGLMLLMKLALGHGAQFSPEEEAWMDRQRAVDGTKCCNVHDIFMLTDVQWRMHEGSYQVRAFGAWHNVPPGRMMRHEPDDPNPFAGIAIVFYTRHAGTLHIWCFVPGTLM